MSDNELAKRLREFRNMMGVTQQFVAKALGIDRSTYTYYETGKARIPTDKLIKLAQLYNIDITDFLDFGGMMLRDTTSGPSRKSEIGQLSREEREILATIRLLDSDKKEKFYAFLEEISNDDRKNED